MTLEDPNKPGESPFKRVDLFVDQPKKDNFVATVEVPHFLTPPQVIMWGMRVFLRDAVMSPMSPNHASYVECFAVAAVREV